MTAFGQRPQRSVQASRLRALVIDDHPIVVEAVSAALAGMRLFDVVECATSLVQARSLLERNPACALAILDLHLGDVEARDLLLAFRERFPDVPVMVFTGDSTLESITMAFECGARAYVTKSAPVPVVAGAIRMVLSGGTYVPPEAMSALGFAISPQASAALPAGTHALRLSGRQSQVLDLLLQGMPNKVIGARLSMAEGTVKAHLNAIFRALAVRTRVEAILRAREMGLI